MTRSLLFASLLLSAVSGATPPAAATAAMAAGRFERAVALLDRALAQASDPKERAELHLAKAQCFLALRAGPKVRAALLKALESDPQAQLDRERDNPELIGQLEKLRAQLTGTLELASDARGATARVDGRAVGPLPLKLELAIGRHELTVESDDGARSATRSEVVFPNAVTRAVVALPEAAAAPPEGPVTAASDAKVTAPPRDEPPAEPPPRPAAVEARPTSWAWLGPAALGTVLLASGVTSFALAKRDAAALRDDPTLSPAAVDALAARGQLEQTLGLIGIGAGLVALAGAAFTAWWRAGDAPQVSLFVRPGAVGLGLAFTLR